MSLSDTVFKTHIPFVKVGITGFLINNQYLNPLDLHIHSFKFMRKLFSENKIACYSMDAVTGNAGHQCCLCDWNYRCTKVIRLKVMVENTTPATPAMLDVNATSFPSIDHILETIPHDELHEVLVTATINNQNNGLKIDFKAQF
jgi:hypothetical protein